MQEATPNEHSAAAGILPVDTNAIQRRAHQVMVELYVMRIPLDDVCARHGLDARMARELAVQAYNDILMRRDYGQVLASGVVDLLDVRNGLQRLLDIEDEGERWHEELTRKGDVQRLTEQ